MKTKKEELDYVLAFTEIYQSESDIYLREAKCLQWQTPQILVPLEKDDLVAGRMQHRFVGFSPQYGGLYTYFFHEDKVEEALSGLKGELSEEYVTKMKEITAFWEEEKTLNRLNKRFHEMGYSIGAGYHEPGISNSEGRLAGTTVDLDKLITLGLDGLKAEICAKAKENQQAKNFYQALLMTVDTIADACNYYEKQAQTLYALTKKESLFKMAEALHSIQTRAPQSFLEGIQLLWVYAMISDLMNYGRMDVALGDLYVKDIDVKGIDEESVIAILESVYRHMLRVHKIHDSRVIIGGKGRRNEQNADRFAMTIMETSRRVKEVVPQLTLRYYTGMDEAVFDKALAVNAEGCTYPIIYSDDTNIPAVMQVYGVSEKEAERYLPFGCGEYVLEGASVGTPNNGVNLLKALEITLHNGYDPYWKKQLGLKTGEPDSFKDFEDLWKAYQRQLRPSVEKPAIHKRLNYDVAAEQAGYLQISLLMDDCISRGKGILNGGVRYENASSEVFGMISAADSLTAIKKLVFDEKRYTLKELVEVLDSNFEGREDVRQELLVAPKYGNDDDYADEIACRVFKNIADLTIEAGKMVGLNHYNMVSVNNSMSAEWGDICMASACGRKAGAPMANANSASIGADKNGITALLNSMSKFDNNVHVGVINNVRFTKELFASSYEKVKAVLRTFYENGGVQTNIGVVGRDDLENAMKTPEKYQNLLVRIGGFSARFVELSPIIQNEILLRTTYGS
ncbi:pyruvate formate lyase family protein [Scatolibacter rhodanostii]|uniref:pyruvate formate lyase family protein n=1 Tax=Scatolibacter rhodanostii TaxID=2014781 RepID=UPI000C0788AC|nr:pyruvate formate lyase family protein [Scatolibacter rhodanostii]